jgi:membrane associated rhomboid family serine protease
MPTTPFTYTPSVWIVPSILVLLLWSVFGIEVFWHLDMAELGIYPRRLSGLVGVVCSPFIHGDISHLFNNTVPLFLLTAAMVYFYRSISLKVLFYGILVSGLLTWIIGRESYHIGASGLIYVLVSFIFFKGIQTKYYRLVALSLTVIVVYGGMIWYVFPTVDSGISWEGHLSGLLTGFVFVHLFQTPHYTKVIRYDWEKEEFDPMQDGFMKHFDANGNFNPLPKAEETETESSTASLPFVSIHYEYKESEK